MLIVWGSFKDEIINWKETVIKWLQGDNEKLCDKCWKLENKLNAVETSLDALQQYRRRSNVVILASQTMLRTLTLNQKWYQSSLTLMLMLNEGKWTTVTELVNLIMVQKRPSLDLPIGNTVNMAYWIGNTWK